MCGLDDSSISDRKKQQIGERRLRPPAHGFQQVRADVHFDPGPFARDDILLHRRLAKRDQAAINKHR